MNPDGNLSGHATGEVELEGSVLVIKRIHVRMELRAPEDQRNTAERAHAIYADSCPVYRSLKAAIAITTELDFRPT
ncbi:MAG TPA: OsmC family protein [Myxococcales bacterium]|nr:OsmC family protein [Myxococcales bacterium]